MFELGAAGWGHLHQPLPSILGSKARAPESRSREGAGLGGGPTPRTLKKSVCPADPLLKAAGAGPGTARLGGCLSLTLTPRNKRLRTVGPQVTHI